MPGTSDVAAESATSAHRDRTADSANGPSHVPALLARVPRLGVWAWSFVGFVVASIIVIVALAAVSEIVLPMTFAAVLAIVFKPLVRILERHKLWPALAAGIVVLGLLGVVTGVIIATVRGVTQQADHGIVGLILAVPVTVIAGNAIARLRSRGILQRAAELARPAVHTCSTDLDAADPLILRGHFGNHPI